MTIAMLVFCWSVFNVRARECACACCAPSRNAGREDPARMTNIVSLVSVAPQAWVYVWVNRVSRRACMCVVGEAAAADVAVAGAPRTW